MSLLVLRIHVLGVDYRSIEVFTDTVQDSGRPNKTMDNGYNRACRVYVMIFNSRLDSMIFWVDILDFFFGTSYYTCTWYLQILLAAS